MHVHTYTHTNEKWTQNIRWIWMSIIWWDATIYSMWWPWKLCLNDDKTMELNNAYEKRTPQAINLDKTKLYSCHREFLMWYKRTEQTEQNVLMNVFFFFFVFIKNVAIDRYLSVAVELSMHESTHLQLESVWLNGVCQYTHVE